MRSLLAGLLVTCAAAASAVAAQESTLVATPRFVPAAGPVLAGADRLAWVSRRDDAVLDLWVSEPGLRPRRVQRYSGADSERLRSPRLTASAEAIGLKLRVTDLHGHALRTLTYAGPFGEPLRPAATLPAPALAQGQAVQVARGCESAEIRTGAFATLGAVREPVCALRLRSPLRLRGDRLQLGISCAGFRIDCFADVVVRAGERVIARGPARYNHTTPPYAAARLRVTPADRRRLRAGMRVRLSARIDDAGRSGAVARTTLRSVQRATR